jgi:hypothetical protein
MKINACFGMNEVSLYMDGVSFLHKFNPMRMREEPINKRIEAESFS